MQRTAGGRTASLLVTNRRFVAISITNRWDVRSGVYYKDLDPFDIVTLTNEKFIYRDRGHDHATYTLQRITKEAAARY